MRLESVILLLGATLQTPLFLEKVPVYVDTERFTGPPFMRYLTMKLSKIHQELENLSPLYTIFVCTDCGTVTAHLVKKTDNCRSCKQPMIVLDCFEGERDE